MSSNLSLNLNFSNSSAASNKRVGIVGRTRAALSSLSSPVDSWGVSHVPVLSPRQIVPRRTRSSRSNSHQGGESIRSSISSHQKSTGERAQRTMSRATSTRLLSISSVSTFGAWIPESSTAGKNASESNLAMCTIDQVFLADWRAASQRMPLDPVSIGSSTTARLLGQSARIC